MNYSLMSPPFEVKPFFEMNKKEAEQHFNWYLGEVPKRIIILKELFTRSNENGSEVLDYSLKSLITLWRWYLKNVHVLPKSKKEYKQEIMQYPEYVRYSVSKNKVEIAWMEIAMDIGIYFALCFLVYSENLKWGYVTKPPNLDCVNKPVILGFDFKMEFSPMDIMVTMVSKATDGRSTEIDLAKTFEFWVETYLKSTQ